MTKVDVSSPGNGVSSNSGSKVLKEVPAAMATGQLPLVLALNCLEDWQMHNADALSGIAVVEHINLAQVAEGKLETAAAVMIHSLVCLPRAAQRRLQPWQLILCLGSSDKAQESAAAAEKGLKLIHVDCSRHEEVADTVMALLLGLLRHTHSLAAQGFGSGGWYGSSVLPLCKGMRRSRGLVMGIIGRSSSACALAVRCLAFKMRVVFYETEETREHSRKCTFPSAVIKVESLQELLSQSDIVSLHCALTSDTVQIINAETLQYIKPGAVIINSASYHLLDDCAVKQALIDGIIAGCALDGVEGPQWLEAWVREMPNVLILPKSADYSDDAWNEIRLKAFSMLRSYLADGVVPASSVSEDDDDWQDEKNERSERDSTKEDGQWIADSKSSQQFHRKQLAYPPQEIREPPRGMYSKSGGKKSKKRGARRKSHQVPDSFPVPERDANWVALQRDDPGGTSGRDQAVNSTSRFTSPDDKARREEADVSSEIPANESHQAIEVLKEGYVVAVRPAAGNGYYVARQKGPGRSWCLDVMSDVTPRDPAAQFLVVLRNRDRLGLRSLAAGGKLLQSNKKSELVFLNHNFDMWESWVLEGSQLNDCTLMNSKFRGVSMDVSMEVLAAVGEDDGVARWLS